MWSIGAPTSHAADIELAIFWIESTTVGSGEELAWQRYDSSLFPITQYEEVRACTEGEVDQLVFQRPPLIAVDSYLATGRVVESAG